MRRARGALAPTRRGALGRELTGKPIGPTGQGERAHGGETVMLAPFTRAGIVWPLRFLRGARISPEPPLRGPPRALPADRWLALAKRSRTMTPGPGPAPPGSDYGRGRGYVWRKGAAAASKGRNGAWWRPPTLLREVASWPDQRLCRCIAGLLRDSTNGPAVPEGARRVSGMAPAFGQAGAPLQSFHNPQRSRRRWGIPYITNRLYMTAGTNLADARYIGADAPRAPPQGRGRARRRSFDYRRSMRGQKKKIRIWPEGFVRTTPFCGPALAAPSLRPSGHRMAGLISRRCYGQQHIGIRGASRRRPQSRCSKAAEACGATPGTRQGDATLHPGGRASARRPRSGWRRP